MPLYEHVFVARQDVSGQHAEDLAREFAKIIEDNGGKIAKAEYWGLRNLAYRIKNNRKGHYVLLNIDALPDAVHEMERQIRLNDDVIRDMTVRVEELEEGPSAMLRGKAGNEGRILEGIGGGERKSKSKEEGEAA